jgi:hypothetical protein
MPIEDEKLLALKAFYLGHGIAERSVLKHQALSMIDVAIAQLRASVEERAPLHLAFYHILRAEILRHEASPIQDRSEAQRICKSINSNLYAHFMAIEDATQSRKTLDGIQTLRIVDEGIKRTESYWANDGWAVWEVRYDIATHALGVNQRDLSDKQRQFLERASLKELLDGHGIAYAP